MSIQITHPHSKKADVNWEKTKSSYNLLFSTNRKKVLNAGLSDIIEVYKDKDDLLFVRFSIAKTPDEIIRYISPNKKQEKQIIKALIGKKYIN